MEKELQTMELREVEVQHSNTKDKIWMLKKLVKVTLNFYIYHLLLQNSYYKMLLTYITVSRGWDMHCALCMHTHLLHITLVKLYRT